MSKKASSTASKSATRVVPAFTVQSRQKNTISAPLPRSRVECLSKPEPINPSMTFRKFYDRGDLPVQIEHRSTGNRLIWKTAMDQLDYEQFLPVFFEGLRERQHPYAFIARNGCNDLLDNAGDQILPSIPGIIPNLKTAMNTNDPEIVAISIKLIQKIILASDFAGEALVPYYRQILPTMRKFKGKNLNIGDKIQFPQSTHLNMGDLIDETLQLLEEHGGPNAFINIKYIVPTYQSPFGAK